VTRAAYQDWLYAIEWLRTEQRERGQEVRPLPARGTWLLLADRTGTSAHLSAQLRDRGYRCIQALAGDRYACLGPDLYELDAQDPASFQRLLQDALGADGRLDGAVHLCSLDAAVAQDTTSETLERDCRRGTLSALYLAKALLMKGWRDVPPLSLVTRGVHALGAPQAALAVSSAPLWGFGRTLALEHPELRCLRIDLGPIASDDDASALLGELLWRDGESDIALRDSGRHVGRLRRTAAPAQAAQRVASGPDAQGRDSTAPSDRPAVRADGAYLITGSRHPLGLAAAEWLVAQGARHLVLVDREVVADASSPAAISALRQAGARVLSLAADVGQPGEAARALAAIDSWALPLRGVLHLEEIIDDSTVFALDAKRLWKVMAAKAQGAWNLHTLTRDRSLDWFVLGSSFASVLGSPGQANYAAASAFLDGLAQYRRASGLCGLSINWGDFHEEGAPSAAAGARFYRGIDPITPSQGVEILGRLLSMDTPQVGALKLNLRHWVEYYPVAASSPLLSELQRESVAAPQGPAAASPFHEILAQARPEDRQALLERHICEQLGLTLHQDVSRISPQAPLRSLGLDSMMAMELRNRLESSLNLKLSSSLLFTHTDIVSLAKHALAAMGFAASAPAAPASERTDIWTTIERDIDQMSDDEAESLLLESIQAAAIN
jgi:NAD(P)-dependent dehydrogenase (short-subunit alcohol dehydrogenase family)/acyl carrier protein